MGRLKLLDFMKGVAILGVIVIHIATERLAGDNSLFDTAVYETFFGLAHYCVPFFLMITGYLLLSPDRKLSIKRLYTHYILRIIIAAFIYGIIYKLLREILDGSLSSPIAFIVSYIKEFVTGKLEFHFWYVYVIVGIYIMLPVLRAFISAADKKLIEYFLAVWFITNIFFTLYRSGHLIFIGDVLDGFHFVGLFVEYTGYTMLGYYLMTYTHSHTFSVICTICGTVAIVLAIIMMTYDNVLFGYYRLEYRAYCGPVVVLYSTMLLLMCKELKLNYDRGLARAFCYIGQGSLDIYFIHMLFIIIIFQYDICNFYIMSVVDMVLYTLVVLLLSAFCAYVADKARLAIRCALRGRTSGENK